MQLITEWRDVVRHAWSVRFLALALVAICLDAGWPLLDGYLPIPQVVFAVLSGLFAGAGLVARVVAQKALSGRET